MNSIAWIRRAAPACAAAGLVALGLAAAPLAAQTPAAGFADPLLGRWDLIVEDPAGAYPSWLEVSLRTEDEIMGRFVGRVGSVRFASTLDYDAGALQFTVPVQYEVRDSALEFEGRLEDGRLEGTTEDDAGRTLRWTGRRAPALLPDSAPDFDAPRALLSGVSLDGWHPRAPGHEGCWQLVNGELAATPPCVDLITDATFGDFVLHAEFSYPARSNSGIYLRGRYEVQIQDDANRALDALRMGGIYGFIAPAVAAARPPGEWQALDITLVGRRVTVALNGMTIIDGQNIPGITGGALDSREAAPGPIMLQGDHGPIRLRNLTIRPAR
jgi:hypothetical protein